MAVGTSARPWGESIADLLERLGGIPADRIRLSPAPGTATEQDLVRIYDREKRRYELVEGTLVEKTMGLQESILTGWIGHLLWGFLEQQDLGPLCGSAAPTRLVSGLIRIPDLSFFSWQQLPNEEVPDVEVIDIAPELVVEVVSKGNTRKELNRKLQEYFAAGVRLVWLVHPRSETVAVYTTPTEKKRFSKEQSLDGGVVLPGLVLPLKKLFSQPKRRRGHRKMK